MKTKNKMIALVEIAVVLCAVFLVATLPAIAADTQKVSASKVTTIISEDDYVLGIYGNANEDNTIDMGDVVYIKLVIFGKKDKTELCDAKYDGRINVLDVIQTKLIILGKEKALTVIDLADRTVTINQPVERVIVVIGGSPLDYVAVEGGKNPFKRIVGWDTGWTTSRAWIYEKYKERFPEIEDIPDVGYPNKGTFNVEKIISLKPDVVSVNLYNYESAKDDIKKLKQAGIPIIFVDFHVDIIENPIESTLLLGYVFDKEERAQDIVDFYTEQVNEGYSRVEKIDKPKPKVYLEVGNKGASTYGNTYGSYGWGALIGMCGGMNIAIDLFVKTGKINPEYLLDENPDVIVITGSSWTKRPDSMRLGYYANLEESKGILQLFTERPGWDTLNAVKNHRVHSVFHGFSSHIYNFAGIQALAKYCYPEEFEDLDPEESFKEYHERFLPVDYSGVWTLSLEE